MCLLSSYNHKSLHYTLHVNSFQLDSVGPGLPGRHPEPGSPASLLPPGDGAGTGRVLGPHPHRVHHRGLGARDQGQDQLPGGAPQVLHSAAPHAEKGIEVQAPNCHH